MKYFVVILSLLLGLNSSGQEKGIVYYGQIKSPTMGGPYGPEFNAYMVFNENESYYVTAKDSLETTVPNNNGVYTAPDGGGMVMVSPDGNLTTAKGNQIYYNRKKDSLWWNKGGYYVAEKRPVIDWELQNETKKIGDFTVHKATGFFRGRNYTAWYTTEIPLPYGPWKLQGLPGLILEAYDEKKEMYLYFKSLEYPTDRDVPITQVQRPENAPQAWHTIQDYANRLRKIMAKAFNQTVIYSEKYGGPSPDRTDMSDVYIESF